MKIPYTKKNLVAASSALPYRSVAGISDNIEVLNFFSTASSPAEARKDALGFLNDLLNDAIGKDLNHAELAENVLAEAAYSRQDLDEPGKTLVSYRWHNVFVRYGKSSSPVQLELDRELAAV